jgi:prepilin-type N-terminal cleavage/methylation domain-containing protein
MIMDDRREDGFTLIELLVSMTISGIIIAAVATAAYVGIRTTADNQRGLQQSNAEQLTGNWFISDVQSACDPNVSAPSCPRSPNPASSSTTACGSSAVTAMDTYDSPDSSSPDTTIAYILQSSQLTRVTCAYGGTSAATTSILATNVQSASVSYPTSGSCSGQFQLSVTQSGTTLGNGTSAYTFTLCADPRA